ncbi:MAG TPA: hypothetical protein VK476_06895 [Flavobacterium sp.]|nr:hypothetical protein [Flavobacterium sp.]
MKTKNLFFTIVLLILAGITNSHAQSHYDGSGTGSSNTGNFNIGFGINCLVTGTGGYNTAMGTECIDHLTTGAANCAFGTRSLEMATEANNNVAIGHRTLGLITDTANYNVGLGYGAFINTVSPSYNNVALGASAGENLDHGTGNVFIGPASGPTAPTVMSDKLFIHNSSTPYPLIYGDFATRDLKFYGDLEVTGTTTNSSGLTFTNLNSSSTSLSSSNGKVLTVDSTGKVILTTDDTGSGGSVINNGTNTTVSGTGTSGAPYQIAAKNIYTDNGILTDERIVDLNGHMLQFTTAVSDDPYYYGVYIGNGGYAPANTGSYRLWVEGGIMTEKLKVALYGTMDWDDFVFAEDYHLMPLKEVESFVKQNSHLPGIESAQELVDCGLDLGAMQAKQMGKIEELTLYVIEQEKKLEQQGKEIEELKVQMKALLERK